MDEDLYAFFGITTDFSLKDLKRAYKDKARQLHPDKNKENPRAKEEFQQLKKYYDLLHDPATRKEYDKKWKAKLEAAKRHQAMDDERRRLKEKLEAQEERARLAREQARRQSAQATVADQLRREWQHRIEQEEREANLRRKRVFDAQVHAAENPHDFQTENQNTILRIKWNIAENPEAATCYTKSFLLTCLSEYGTVVTLVLGKSGTAVAEFRSHADALEAVRASEKNLVGLPTLPLHLSFVHPPEHNGHASDETWRKHTKITHDSGTSFTTESCTNFDSFESEILARMANFAGKS